eukprot:655556-Alexandrium_andersonii.AAC.1
MLIPACDPLLGLSGPEEDPVHLGTSALGEPYRAKGAPQGSRRHEDASAHNESAALSTKAQVVAEGGCQSGAAAPAPAGWWEGIGLH